MEIIVICLLSVEGRGKGKRHRVNKKNLKMMEEEVQCTLLTGCRTVTHGLRILVDRAAASACGRAQTLEPAQSRPPAAGRSCLGGGRKRQNPPGNDSPKVGL